MRSPGVELHPDSNGELTDSVSSHLFPRKNITEEEIVAVNSAQPTQPNLGDVVPKYMHF